MSWCLLRGNSCTLPVNVIDLRFDGARRARTRPCGSLTVEVAAEDDRATLDELVRDREPVVLERAHAGAVEMRLVHVAGRTRARHGGGTKELATATYEWVAP